MLYELEIFINMRYIYLLSGTLYFIYPNLFSSLCLTQFDQFHTLKMYGFIQ